MFVPINRLAGKIISEINCNVLTAC